MALKKGELSHGTFTPNDDGSVQVVLHKKPKPGRKNTGPWLSDGDTEEKLGAKDHREASRHVARALSEHFGGGVKNTPTPGVKAGKPATVKVDHPANDDGPNPETDSF
jgi:hypothetical protein